MAFLLSEFDFKVYSQCRDKGVTSVLYSIAVLENFIQDKKEGVFATIHDRDSRHDINEMNMEAIFAVRNTT